jgi:hypothetical protein
MNGSDDRILSIFADALACASVEDRVELLDRACREDAALRARVEALLEAHREAGDFLKGRDAPADFSASWRAPRPAPSSARTSSWK